MCETAEAARECDAVLYQALHLVENGFERFKARHGVVTRYAKTAASYLATCRIRLWLSGPG